jgi:16S rRNA (guanine966-N2)-methyltransferase
MNKHNPGRGYRNEFRIIAGQWRRRKLHFPPLPDIRPSPDRVRETLFNWLRERIEGAACLDLFAGSGALGLEALSRGAAAVVFVDRERVAVQALREHLNALGAVGGEAVQADALSWLEGPARAFDVVFLDPPFDSELLTQTAEQLEQRGWLKDSAVVYLEHPAERVPTTPANWRMLRESRAGRVGFRLLQRTV